jgi:uncharacterized protein (DUF1697 family)
MRYVALLRGINVGGANKVSMAELKVAFEAAGMTQVRTYINSGNVVFSSTLVDRARLAILLRESVRNRVFVDVDLLVRDADELRAIVDSMPAHWRNDAAMKCDVVFLADGMDAAAVLEELQPRPGIEDAMSFSGAVVWRVDRQDATRSRLTRIVGTPLYKRVTVRNCNTVRRLAQLMESAR